MTYRRGRELLLALMAVMFVGAIKNPSPEQLQSPGRENAAAAAASPSATSSVSPYPSPLDASRSVNTYLYIVSDDADVIKGAQQQASQAGNPTPMPSPTASGATLTPAPISSAVSEANATLNAVATAAATVAAKATSSPAVLAKANSTLNSAVTKAKTAVTASNAAATTPAPSAAPSPGAGSSDVTGAVLNTASAMNTDLQTYLVQEFKRRGIPVVTENQFKDYCLHKNLAYALHWSVVDPSLSVQRNWELFGYTGSTLELYWHLTTCNALEEVLLYSDDPAGTIYHTTAGRTYQVRAPTDFLASLFGLFALVHPAGKALVSIGVTGGISAVSGSLNTILNSSYAAHDLVQSTEHIAAWQVANAYCSGKSAPQCKFTRAPHH